MDAVTAEKRPEPADGGIAALQPGRPLNGRFAVARKDRQQSKAGTPYLSLELRDRTGSIPARIFREADQLGARFERGDAIEARGKVERFRGNLSVELTALRRIEPGSFDPAEFLPSAYRSVEELEGFFDHLTGEVYDPALRRLTPTSSPASTPRSSSTSRRTGRRSRSPTAGWRASPGPTT
jgi:3'-5' exoribonuclease